jgi:DNA-binding transcriptional MocR family regulator
MISPVRRTGGRQTGRGARPPGDDDLRASERSSRVLAALGERLPELEPAGIAAGLHLVAYLPDDLDEAAVERAAAERGVAVYGLRPYRLAAAGRPGLIFGYATLDEHTIRTGVEVLAEAIETTMTNRGTVGRGRC